MALAALAAAYLSTGIALAETADFEPFDAHSLGAIKDAGMTCDNGITGQVGHESKWVMMVQTILDADGYDLGASGVDGGFGPVTEEAVEDWQFDRGFAATGCWVSSQSDHVQLQITPNPEVPPQFEDETYAYREGCGCERKFRIEEIGSNPSRFYEKVKRSGIFKNAVNCNKTYTDCRTLFD